MVPTEDNEKERHDDAKNDNNMDHMPGGDNVKQKEQKILYLMLVKSERKEDSHTKTSV